MCSTSNPTWITLFRLHKCYYCDNDVSSLWKHGLHSALAQDISRLMILSKEQSAWQNFQSNWNLQTYAKMDQKPPYECFNTGKPLAWDFTWSNTLRLVTTLTLIPGQGYILSYDKAWVGTWLHKSVKEAGKTAAGAENNKFTAYGNTLMHWLWTSFFLKLLGQFGRSAK